MGYLARIIQEYPSGGRRRTVPGRRLVDRPDWMQYAPFQAEHVRVVRMMTYPVWKIDKTFHVRPAS